ncbi:MAG: CIA30 family protein [Gammaproteobacteria bacterium]|nr:CIA30 family protein [Gammaproteobacteria bacterium]
MGELKQFHHDNAAIVRKPEGNPEGKGLNGFLLDWFETEPRGVVAKPRRQILAELFTSMLVLSASFKFRPAVGVATYLYWIHGEWSLSLIAPHEWSSERRAGFAGRCVLQPDMTWTITPSGLLGESNPVSDAVGRFFDTFAATLDTDVELEEILPFYVPTLHYYQRLYASALSRSVRAAVILGEQANTSCRQWNLLLPQLQNVLPAYHPDRLDVPPLLITDFTSSSADLGWYTVNDEVMGGRSEGDFRRVQGELIFAGRTNTKGGGFSSIRTKALQLDLSRYKGVRLYLRGDGRRYTWRLATAARLRNRPIVYSADFDTRDGAWITVDIPFASFVPRFRGSLLDAPALDPAHITGMGLMIYDQQDGPFELHLQRVQVLASVQ